MNSVETVARSLGGPVEDSHEIDDEMMEIFRWEAEELLAGISTHLATLAASPDDKQALWEIRRNAHTFKGAAGMVGFDAASQLAHKLEDLLDKVVESGDKASADLLELIDRSNSELATLVANPNPSDTLTPEAADEKPVASAFDLIPSRKIKPPAPVLRISVGRLADLSAVSRDVISAIEQIARTVDTDNAVINSCLQQGMKLHETLEKIRLLRFGNLHSRLGAVINATCIEENKKAQFILKTPEAEIDTQIIDVLVEPIMHLLKNAVVHGIEPPDQRLSAGKSEVGEISIAVLPTKGEIDITVSDDGAGMCPGKIKQRAVECGVITVEESDALSGWDAFQLIFREGFSTADKLNLSAGRGIGMNIVREVVEAQNGTIDIVSKRGAGTTFRIRMPDKMVAPAKQSSIVPKETDAKPLVLIVDDSSTIRRRNTDIVEALGFQVMTADNGDHAFRLLASSETLPSLIISDVEMPVMTGWGLLKNVKDDKRFRNIPFLLVTSLDTTTSRQTAAQLGASGYLIKPLTPDSLQRMLPTIMISE